MVPFSNFSVKPSEAGKRFLVQQDLDRNAHEHVFEHIRYVA